MKNTKGKPEKQHEIKGYCRCGRKRDLYTKSCSYCLLRFREDKYRLYGHIELIENYK
jgi:hypothetical protein